jgi:hypothetical protein
MAISVHGFFKNGKIKKGPAAGIMHFENEPDTGEDFIQIGTSR